MVATSSLRNCQRREPTVPAAREEIAQTLVYYYGEWVDGYPASNSDTTGSYTTGLDAVITVDFPLSAIPNATEVTALRAMVGDFKALLVSPDAPVLIHDEAVGEGTLVVREPPAEPAPDASAPADETTAQGEPASEATAPTTLSPQSTDRADTPFPGALALLALALAVGAARPAPTCRRRGGDCRRSRVVDALALALRRRS